MAYISMKNVSFAYPDGFLALDGIDLEIGKGENVAIIGQNGAGKTTAVKMLNGLCKPSGGSVTVGGMDTRGYTTAQLSRTAGYVFQNPGDQIFHSTVLSEVAFGPKKLKFESSKKNRLVDYALTVTGLTGRRNMHPYDLPLSIRKFVTIACVIAMDSEVMIFDEPTAGQDLKGLSRLSQIIKQLHGSGKTIITITHDMEFAAENFSRVIVMADKKIAAQGTPREIFWDSDIPDSIMPGQPYVCRLCRALEIPGNIITMREATEAICHRVRSCAVKAR